VFQSSKNPAELSKKLASGLSPAVGLMLDSLVLDPEISLSPYFWTILVFGSVTFVISLGRFLEKKHEWEGGVWHIAGICLAGFALVSWARYDSFLTSFLMEAIIIAIIGGAFFLCRKRLAGAYGKHRRVAYLGLFLCVLLPLTAILPHAGERPLLIVSPSPKFITIPEAGMTQNINVTLTSVYANAWNIRLTAESYRLLAVYLDSREKGPVEIPFLEHGRELIKTLRVETSPQIENGAYSVTLNFEYKDALGQIHTGSSSVEVIVGPTPAPMMPAFLLLPLLIMIVAGIGLTWYVRRRGRMRI